MSFTFFIVDTLFSALILLLLLRVWMQFSRTDFYNPLSQFVVRFTQPMVGPLRRILPSLGSLDSASLLLAYLATVIKITLLLSLLSQQPVFSLTIWIGSLLAVVKAFGKLVFWVLILRALMSWISQGRSPMEYVFMQLTESFLSPIRRLLPNTGMIDFSVMVALFLLTALNYLGTDFSDMLGLSAYWTEQWLSNSMLMGL